MQALDIDGRVWWGETKDNVPRLKRFLSEVKQGVVPQTLWFHKDVGHTQEAKKELLEIVSFADSASVFITPKPTRLLKRIIEIATEPGDTVLDSFAGSGTTGHAILEKNFEDQGMRRFILVEMDDKVSSETAALRLKNLVAGYEGRRNQKHVLKEVQITLRNLRNAHLLVEDFELEGSRRSEEFDVVNIELEGTTLKLIGERTASQKANGLGSGFRFCALGEPLFDADGNVSPAVTYSDLAAHVFFCDTGSPIPQRADGSSALIGTFQGRAIYLLFAPASIGFASPKAGNVLTASVLDALPLPEPGFDGPRIVYAEGCMVPDDRLAAAGVTFRQVPYQVEGL